MANMFPECVGGVDVVSDAENIKRLLQLPYSQKTVVSMIVHRIENTILIDEFDIHKYLLRQSNADWQWLRSFIFENILNSLNDKQKKFQIKSKSREVLHHNNLTSKFLYYSIKNDKKDDLHFDFKQPVVEAEGETIHTYSPLPFVGPLLPEPKKEENLPDPKSDHVFNRNVLWTFEDIRMLIGTDMPIFGSSNRPCISLRLRDMKKPINVLTGIDYWLDNLMCNVPEVMMCYHLDGLVQKYEIIKTEDLPNLKNSKFSPKIIRNVAQNILSFLKSNATKSGHTYWLFKGKHDDFVKLYDLTTLCKNNETKNNDGEEDNCDTNDNNNNDEPGTSTASGQNDTSKNNKNPFTIPVAMLLYTVARNMKNSHEKMTPKKAGSIRTLLDNCIKLLPKDKHPQIVTSSHYILSDLYIPDTLVPSSPNFINTFSADMLTSPNSSTSHNIDTDEEDSGNSDVAMKNINETLKEFNQNKNKTNTSSKPLYGSLVMRCTTALQHVIAGLHCLQYLKNENDDLMSSVLKKQQIIHEEQNPNLAQSNQAIPLPYQTLHKEAFESDSVSPTPVKDDLNSKVNGESAMPSKGNQDGNEISTVNTTPLHDKFILFKGKMGDVKSWKMHLKILLFEKACLIYATLAENSYANGSYGKSLRYIFTSIKCQFIVTKCVSSVSSQRCLLLGRAADCLFQMSKNMTNIIKYRKDFVNPDILKVPEFIEYMNKELENETFEEDDIKFLKPSYDIEDLMISSCEFYEAALACSTAKSNLELIRRLGNATNELGLLYMHLAQESYNDNDKNDLYIMLAKKSYECLFKGIKLFEQVNDDANLAFLLCNMGRFLRFRAHIHLWMDAETDITVFQKHLYQESFNCYERALGIIISRKENPELWDMVKWELSTATFTLTKTLQDRWKELSPEENFEDAKFDEDVLEMLHKSLKLCDTDTISSKQILYIQRAALIHQGIAAYYHSLYRNIEDDPRKKNLHLCRMHFEKAIKFLDQVDEPALYIEIQMERIALQLYISENAQSVAAKKSNLLHTIEFFVQTTDMLKKVNVNHLIESNGNEDLQVFLIKFERNLQLMLRTLAKLCVNKATPGTSYYYCNTQGSTIKKDAEICKQMFGATLRRNTKMGTNAFIEYLVEVVAKVNELSGKVSK